MGYQRRPNTPLAVERQLRQEAGFGCAKCGHPYVEYHHIVPYAEEQHFRPEDMLALCGNCHPAVSKQHRDRQYTIKENPFNQKAGRLLGALEYDKRDLVFRVGGNWYENTNTILKYFNEPIISCRLEDGQAKVSLVLLDQLGGDLLRVTDNEIDFRIDNLWDFEYAHNVAIARYGHRDVALRMDFRGDTAVIEGKLWLGQQQVILSSDETSLYGNNTLSGCRFSGIGTAIQVGDPSQNRPILKLLI